MAAHPRITIVTGGTSGIGKAAADSARNRSGEVFVIDRRDEDAVADLTTRDGRGAAARAVEARYLDGVDAVLCYAGMSNISGSGALQLFRRNALPRPAGPVAG